MEDDTVPDYCKAEVLVLGCGNPLVGDDGFGPAVAERLLGKRLPWGLCVINVETSSRSILFNLATGPSRPGGIIIIDAMNAGRRPGTIFEASLEELSREKADDFTLHLTPISNMLVDLKKMGVGVRLLACQPSPLPDRIRPGLSKAVEGAVEKAARRALKMAAEMAIESAEKLLGKGPRRRMKVVIAKKSLRAMMKRKSREPARRGGRPGVVIDRAALQRKMRGRT